MLTINIILFKIQYRGLRYVYNDYSASYDSLLGKSEMCTIELLLQKIMLVEIFKCVHGIGASYLADFFNFGKTITRGENLFVPRVNSTLYGLHSIRYHGTKLWAALDNQSKSSKDLADFKTSLMSFKGIKCKCNYCKYTDK